MFICEICQKPAPPRVNSQRIVAKTRYREYPRRKEVHPATRGRKKFKDDPGGTGKEIVKEVIACPKCVEEEVKANSDVTIN